MPTVRQLLSDVVIDAACFLSFVKEFVLWFHLSTAQVTAAVVGFIKFIRPAVKSAQPAVKCSHVDAKT